MAGEERGLTTRWASGFSLCPMYIYIFFLIEFKKYFIYLCFGCAGSSLLCRLYLTAVRGSYSPVEVCMLLIAVASRLAEHGL